MTPERWQQMDQLFKAALACEPAQRAEFLAAKCKDDEPLRREVESLLSSLEDADGFIETPAGDIAAELLGTHRSTYEPGQQIQNYWRGTAATREEFQHHPEAYELYLRGRFYQRDRAGDQKARDYLEQAIEKDPNYAPAYAQLAYTYVGAVLSDSV